MKNFRQLTKFLLFMIFTVFAICLFFKEYDLRIVLISAFLIFLVEFVYYIFEQKSNVVLISTGNISVHRKNSIIILIFAAFSIFITIYGDGLIIRNLITSILFGFLGLRGVIFTEQTVASIRIFNQGFEYGFWNRFVRWDKILNYELSTDNNKILIEKSGMFWKKISIKFDRHADLVEFENHLNKINRSIDNKQ
jgi:hypothetical protein